MVGNVANPAINHPQDHQKGVGLEPSKIVGLSLVLPHYTHLGNTQNTTRQTVWVYMRWFASFGHLGNNVPISILLKLRWMNFTKMVVMGRRQPLTIRSLQMWSAGIQYADHHDHPSIAYWHASNPKITVSKMKATFTTVWYFIIISRQNLWHQVFERSWFPKGGMDTLPAKNWCLPLVSWIVESCTKGKRNPSRGFTWNMCRKATHARRWSYLGCPTANLTSVVMEKSWEPQMFNYHPRVLGLPVTFKHFSNLKHPGNQFANSEGSLVHKTTSGLAPLALQHPHQQRWSKPNQLPSGGDAQSVQSDLQGVTELYACKCLVLPGR